MPPPSNTAASKPKRHKKRKSRTQVSSDSSSASSSESDFSISNSSPKPSKKVKTKTSTRSKANDGPAPDQQPKTAAARDPAPAAFTQFILQTSTLEFADDLDLVRVADDFKGAESIEMLVHALKQGSGCFSIEEMTRVADAAGKSKK